MGFLADKTVFSPLTKEILEESISFSCGNEDLDGFFHNDAVSYAENLFGKSYCYYLEESKADIVCAFTVSNASIFTKYLPNARKKKVGKHIPHIKQDLIYPAVLIGRLGISTKFRHLLNDKSSVWSYMNRGNRWQVENILTYNKQLGARLFYFFTRYVHACS